jgi:hypothetical protein
LVERRRPTKEAEGFERLSRAFESSARRWELIVYPSLFAFIILAAYGFYLVFSLAKDVHYLAISVDSNMTVMSSNMQVLSEDVGHMSQNVESISRDVGTLEPILTNISSMDKSMQSMTYATTNIRDDMAVMNHNMGRPMQFMNRFMPW